MYFSIFPSFSSVGAITHRPVTGSVQLFFELFILTLLFYDGRTRDAFATGARDRPAPLRTSQEYDSGGARVRDFAYLSGGRTPSPVPGAHSQIVMTVSSLARTSRAISSGTPTPGIAYWPGLGVDAADIAGQDLACDRQSSTAERRWSGTPARATLSDRRSRASPWSLRTGRALPRP